MNDVIFIYIAISKCAIGDIDIIDIMRKSQNGIVIMLNVNNMRICVVLNKVQAVIYKIYTNT